MKKIIISILLQYLFWMLFFFILRAVFLVYNYRLLGMEGISVWEALQAFWYALKLDSATTGYVLVIPTVILSIQGFFKAPWLNAINKTWTLVIIFLFSLIVSAELGTFSEWKTKLTTSAFIHLDNPKEIYFSVSAWKFFSLVGVMLLLTAGSYFIYHKIFFIRIKEYARPLIWPILFTIFCFPLLFTTIRGGVKAIPISQSSAHYSHHAILNWASVNSGYHLAVNMLEKNRYKDHITYQFYDLPEAREIVRKIHYTRKDTTINVLKTNRPNIVILLLESWTADLIKSLGAEPDITPNFRELEKGGLLFTQFYCTGNRSHEAIATLFGGHPALPYTTWPENPEKYRKMPSMVRMLNDTGYSSSFYFGGELDYGNMRAYLLFNQFGQIVEEKDIDPSIPRGRLGVHDEFLFNRHIQDARNFPQPFFSVVFTLSSHSPYDQPMEPVIDWAGMNNPFLNSAYYTDKCLGEYFEKCRKEPWYDNTLFIIMADHGHSSQKNWIYESFEYHRIPLLLYGKVLREEFRGKQEDRICDNSSVARTILKQLEMPVDDFKWGVDLFNPYSNEFAYVVLNNGYTWKEPGKEIVFSMKWQDYFKMEFPEGTGPEEIRQFLRKARAYVQVLFQEFLDY